MENVLNTDVIYQGMTFHVQTEDLGVKTGYFQTQIYYRGKILSSERFDYKKLLDRKDYVTTLEEWIAKQHGKAIAQVEKGRINMKDLEPILVGAQQNDRKSGKIKIVAKASRFGKKKVQPKSLFETAPEQSFDLRKLRSGDTRFARKNRMVPAFLALTCFVLISVIALPKMKNQRPREEQYLHCLSLGEQLTAAGKYDEAEEVVSQAVSLFPNRSEGYAQRARLFAEMGAVTRAIEEMGKATALAPGDGALFYEQGDLYLELGDYGHAIARLQDAISTGYETRDIYDSLAAAFYGSGNLSQAEENWVKALRMNPNDPDIFFNLGLVALKRESFGEAIHNFQRVIEIDPGRINAFIHLGDVYYLSGLRDKARVFWMGALELDPENAVVQVKLQSLR